jgi:phospholipid-transporting ATPase
LTCLAGAVFTSFLVFALNWYVFSSGNVFKNGLILDNYFQGSLLYLTTLLTVSMKLAFFTNYLTNVLLVSVACSILAWFPVFLSTTQNFAIFKSPFVWAALILIPITGNLRDFLWKFYQRVFRPRPYHIVQEMDSINRSQSSRIIRAKKKQFSPSQVPLIGGHVHNSTYL